MRLLGQTFGTEIIDRIRKVVSEGVETTRCGLSRRVCEWLDWRSINGELREIDARKALLELERSGLIELPATQVKPPQTQTRNCRSPLLEMEFEGSLDELGEVSLVTVTAKERELSRVWKGLMERHHPLGSGPLCGAQQRYLIQSEHAGWLGGLAFSAAAWHLRERDKWIGWPPKTRRDNLPKVVANSRFLLLPGIRVPHLASHVLGLAARAVAADWPARYGYTPVLLESFVDESQYHGTSYRAANWHRVGETAGRGRQDRYNAGAAGRKGIYLLPLVKSWRKALQGHSRRELRLPRQAHEEWAEHEFGRVDFVDGRLRERLLMLARDFYARPLASIPEACGGSEAKTKAAYRFLSNPNVDLDTILDSHIEATAGRMQAHPVVLAVQDTTSLNYNTHLATEGLGPINTHADGAQGLKLHDTVAFTPDGIALGVLDAQCWARDPVTPDDQSASKRRRSIEETEALRWISSYLQTAQVQALVPETRVVSVADREADIYELFERAQQTPGGPDLLIRANRSRTRRVETDGKQPLLWDHVLAQPEAGRLELPIPGKGGRKARVAELVIRHVPANLCPPRGKKGPSIRAWAVHALEPMPPADTQALEWLLLTTVPVADFDQACERLGWYSARWGIEVYHRTLKSGCRIEDRRLAEAGNLQACLALDMVVAWRILNLTRLGRQTPDLPCTVFFEEDEWKALWAFHTKNPKPPRETPTVGAAMRLVAKMGGFLGRKSDGHPGATVLWRGLEKLGYMTEAYRIFNPAVPQAP
jgi:hypothetical protein